MSRCEECDGLVVPGGVSAYLQESVIPGFKTRVLKVNFAELNRVDREFLKSAVSIVQLLSLDVRTAPKDDAAALELIRAAAPRVDLAVTLEEVAEGVQISRDLLVRGLAECVAPSMYLVSVIASPYSWDILFLALASSRDMGALYLEACNSLVCSPGALRAALLTPTLRDVTVGYDVAFPSDAHVQAIKDAVRLSDSLGMLWLDGTKFSKAQSLEIIKAVAETSKTVDRFTVGEDDEFEVECEAALARVKQRAVEDIEKLRMRREPGRPSKKIWEYVA